MAGDKNIYRSIYLFLSMGVLASCGTSGHLTEILPEQLYRKLDKDSPYPNIYAIPERPIENRPILDVDTELVEGLEQNQKKLEQQKSPEKIQKNEPDWPLE